MLVTCFDELKGKTIEKASKVKSLNNKIKLLHIQFTDGTYCVLLSDHPSIEVNLMDDKEHFIPKVEQVRMHL